MASRVRYRGLCETGLWSLFLDRPSKLSIPRSLFLSVVCTLRSTYRWLLLSNREISRNYMEIIAFWAKTRSIILIFLNIFFLYFKTWLRTRKVIGTFKKRPQGFDWYQTWLFCAICEFFFSKLTTTTSSCCFVSLAQLSVQLMISFALYLSFLGMKFCAVSSSRWIKEVTLKWKFIKINKPLKQFRKDSIFSCIVCYLSVGCNPSFSYITTSQKKEK